MNYLGHSCLESKGDVVVGTVGLGELEVRVASIETKTIHVLPAQSPTRTVVSGELFADYVVGPNLIGGMLTFSGHPVTNAPVQYFNMAGTINHAFLDVLSEGSDDANHNFFVAPFNCTINTLSWSRIQWGPDDPLENGRNLVQFEVGGNLVGTQVISNGVRDYESLTGVEISVGQTVSLQYVPMNYPYWKSIGKIRMFASLVPAGRRSTM